tara:strand:- start:10977 stop:11204 length:228 start_codon:yes stop_codon:yes gene_type:complete
MSEVKQAELQRKKDMYCFSVKCEYCYEILAHDEKTARKILQEQGGFDISGELLFSEDAYKRAELVEVRRGKEVQT